MTTQTQLSDSPQVVQSPCKSGLNFFPWVLASLAIIALIVITIAVIPTKGGNLDHNVKTLEAISARYQGMADIHAANRQLDSQKALESVSAHYQGLANLYGATLVSNSQKALESISARYQGQVDLIAAKRQSDSQKALESISAHYQGLADLYLDQD